MEVLGGIDELNSLIGLARSLVPQEPKELGKVRNELLSIQVILFKVGTAIVRCGESVSNELINELEEKVIKLSKEVSITCFIIPGGHPAASTLHVARAVCRRLERRMVTLSRVLPQCIDGTVLKYINILSDYLYLLALHINRLLGLEEVKVE